MNEQFLNSVNDATHFNFNCLKDKPYVIFWGGVDVNPALYGEKRAPKTQYPDTKRDISEIAMAKYCVKHNIPMIGICRGAQLLNVFNGGKLCQDITNHGGSHTMRTYDGTEIRVNSTHHQMMIPAAHAEILGTAHHPSEGLYNNEYRDQSYTFEMLVYPDTKSLCIQYHPEWLPKDNEAVIFAKDMAKKYLGLNNSQFKDDSFWYGDI